MSKLNELELDLTIFKHNILDKLKDEGIKLNEENKQYFSYDIQALQQKYGKPKKVAIVGFAPHWHKAPFDNKEYEIWTLNEAYKLPLTKPNENINFRADRWFEIHNRYSPSKNKPDHLKFLQECKINVYMQKQYPDIPKSVEFPFNEIMKWYEDRHHLGYRYFTNSISWIIAQAVMEGFNHIEVYGVDMATDEQANGTSEYGYQKPSCEYYLGVAEKYAFVNLPDDSDLLMCHNLYGIESDNESNVWVKKQLQVLKDRSKQFSAQHQNLIVQAKQAEIALAEIRGADTAYKQVLKRRI